jgi:hypothetical protein
LPVAYLRASPDYKNVANCPIMVSRILYLTKLISENKAKPFFERDLVHLELSQGLKGFLTTLAAAQGRGLKHHPPEISM